MIKTTTIAALAAVLAIGIMPVQALACPTCGGGQPTPSYPNPGPFPPGRPGNYNPGPLPPGTGSPVPQPQRPPILVRIQVSVPVPVPVYERRWSWEAHWWVSVRVGTRIEYRNEWRWVIAQWHAPSGCHRYMDGSGTWQRVQPSHMTQPMPRY